MLDEPEVHFNDIWKRCIVFLLDKALKGQRSHILITTHSSIILTDVPNEDILLINRSGFYTEGIVGKTFFPTFGADPGDIMVNVLGADYAMGKRSVDYILKALGSNEPTSEKRDKLKLLLCQVGPGYWSYRIRQELKSLESSP